jgi:bifunctional non-homologous end joining protein LigD
MSSSIKRKPIERSGRLHPSAVPAAMPSVLDPMLATLAKQPFSNPEWLFEPKWDGFRAICFLQEGRLRCFSRNRKSLTERFPELQQIAKLIRASTAVIDGEIVALNKSGMPYFEGLQVWRGSPRHQHQTSAIVLYAFDLLYFDGHDLTQCPLVARKATLKRILPKTKTGRIRYTEHIDGEGEQLFRELEELELEGMVAKRRDSIYVFKRSSSWLKIKTVAGRAQAQKRADAWER